MECGATLKGHINTKLLACTAQEQNNGRGNGGGRLHTIQTGEHGQSRSAAEAPCTCVSWFRRESPGFTGKLHGVLLSVMRVHMPIGRNP